MGPVNLDGLPENALLLVDANPIIYILEQHPELEAVFRPLFEAHEKGLVRLAVTTVTLAEVLLGPLRINNQVLAEHYRSTLRTWFLVDMDADIAESAARLRATLKLKLADAIQAASALAIGADALVTHDRDFSAVTGLRVIGGTESGG